MQENPARVLQGLHGKSTQGFFLKNLYCLECIIILHVTIYRKFRFRDDIPDGPDEGLTRIRHGLSAPLGPSVIFKMRQSGTPHG